MREDKLIRPSVELGLDGALLAAAKNAALAKDEPALLAVVNHVQALATLALAQKNKGLAAHCIQLKEQLQVIARNPGSFPILETKSLARSNKFVSADDDEIATAAAIGTVQGYGAVFNNVDFGGDRILKGAFQKSLVDWKSQGRLPIMLAQHASGTFPIGVWTAMSEDSFGLRVTGDVAATPRGREAWALYNMKPSALDGLSIGFSIVDADFANGVRELRQLKLYEVSLVGLPMNTLARLDRNGKSTAPDLGKALARLSRLVADSDSDSDHDFEDDDDNNNIVLPFPRRSISTTDVDEAELIAAAHRLCRNVRS
jgi:HK97 family phage prohead protease